MRPKPLMPTLMDIPLRILLSRLFGASLWLLYLAALFSNQRRRGRSAYIGVGFLDGSHLCPAEGHKRNLTGRIAIDPVLEFGAVVGDIAFFVARLAHRQQNLFAIHTYDHLIRLDGFLDWFRQFFNIIPGGRLLVEIEHRRHNLLDGVCLYFRNRSAEQQCYRRATDRVGILLPVNGRHSWSHPHLHVILPASSSLALHAVVDFEHDLVAFDRNVRDLHQIPNPRGRTERLAGLRPVLFVILTAGVKRKWLLGARKKSLHRGILGQQPAQDLYAIVFGKLLIAAPGRWRKDGKQDQTSRQRHKTLSRELLTIHTFTSGWLSGFASWCWTGAFPR